MMLRYFAVAHLQYVLHLEHRVDFQKGQMLLASVKSKGSMIEWVAMWFE